MELLDKYLQSVRSYLPREQRDDIIKELSDNILSQMEDKESQLGRPLTASEQEAIINQHGAPLTVVGRYQFDTRSVAFGRQLIGPVLYPFYIRVLSITLGLSMAVHLVIAIALYAARQSITLDGVISSIIVHLAIQFGTITLIFTAAQANATKHPDMWDPVAKAFDMSDSVGSKKYSRFEAFAEIVILLVVFYWLLNLNASQTLSLGADGPVLMLAPFCQGLFFQLLLLTFAGIIRSAFMMLRPDWARLRLMTSVFMDVASVIIVGVLITAGEWILLANPRT
ncbi:MAG TPA: hypothetical protein VEX13_07205, partial [Chloroflexia bacterium]|nr:hypothetical protein [Chloroflexia bacterium]